MNVARAFERLCSRSLAPTIGCIKRKQSQPSTATRLPCRFASAMADSRPAMPAEADAILTYWFGADYGQADKFTMLDEAYSKKWFMGGPAVDQEIKSQCGHMLPAMASGQFDSWLHMSPQAALAGVVLMDQFSRNVYRGDPKAFALDLKSVSWAQHLIDTSQNDSLPLIQQLFIVMAFMHSEDMQHQQRAIELSNSLVSQAEAHVAAGNSGTQPLVDYVKQFPDYAQSHMDVIAKWGRFPHRNQVLGRVSTPEEEAGLADGSIRKFG